MITFDDYMNILYEHLDRDDRSAFINRMDLRSIAKNSTDQQQETETFSKFPDLEKISF